VGLRIVATTFQSLVAKSLAAALPMPEETPVMRTVFFIRLNLAYNGLLNRTVYNGLTTDLIIASRDR
jgi:hypothetical protein